MIIEGIELRDDAIPRHVAIIMDGNGRWAKRHRKPKQDGHKAGSDAVIPVVEAAAEAGVRTLTLYAFSTENWRRPKSEVAALMRLLEFFFKKKIDELVTKGVRVKTIGDASRFEPRIREIIHNAEERSRHNEKILVNVALNYGARDEIVRAVRGIAGEVAKGTLAVDAIDEACISAHLDTAHCKDPDLLIRTSGELRVSNFLLYQIAYAEMWVTDTLWPDFGKKEFATALHAYQVRERRYGGRSDD